jgi:hypothetical protein
MNPLKAFECGEHRRFPSREADEPRSATLYKTVLNDFGDSGMNKSGDSHRTQKPAAKVIFL